MRFTLVCSLALISLAAATDISSCQVISSAGVYSVTANLLTTTSTECLNITADDVWVNCNFYNVSVISTSTSTIKSAIKIARTPSAAIKNVSITNCRINGTYLVYGIQSAFAQNYNYQGNTFEDWTGRAAANGNNGTTTCTNGGNAQASYAIYLAGNTNGTIRDNVFRNGYGGKAGAGGNKTTSGTACNGGIGGALYGVYVTVLTATKTKNTTIVNNTFDNFTTGDSNNGGNSPGNGGNGNKPGTGAFIYLNGAWAEETGIFNNSFGTISSGIPGNGGQTLSACLRCGLCAFLNGDGGDSSTVYWLYFSSSTKLIVKGNTFGTVKTHKGGTGATGGNMYAGAGGSGGWAIGCYATGTNQTIDGNTFVNVTPGDGGDNGAGSCDKGKVPGNGGMGVAFEMGGATTINNFSVFNVSHGIAYKGHGTYDGIDGNGTAVYFEAAQGTNLTNGTFQNLADETVLSSSQVGIGGTTANNNLFLNVSVPFWVVNWDNSGGDYTCDPNCNFTVAWYGREQIINYSNATINVTDNYSAPIYYGDITITPWFIALDSVYDSKSDGIANKTWNAYNCSANTSSETIWQYFNFTSADLICSIIFKLITANAEIIFKKPFWRTQEIKPEQDDDKIMAGGNIILWFPLALFLLVLALGISVRDQRRT